ncbi:Vitamin B12 import ATP-binding protein BtuD [Streptomyces alboniger]
MGRITADGTDIADLGAAAWRHRVCAVFQDFIQYQLPVADNIVMGRAMIRRRSRPCGLPPRTPASSIVEGLPKGWDTPLSARSGGVDLSGGQWQQVVLTRALYGLRTGARLAVFDEPTAHMDVRTEAQVFDCLARYHGDRSVVLISHRLSTVRGPNRIVFLHDGRITENGSHDELIGQGGRYAQMFAIQAERFQRGYDDRQEEERAMMHAVHAPVAGLHGALLAAHPRADGRCHGVGGAVGGPGHEPRPDASRRHRGGGAGLGPDRGHHRPGHGACLHAHPVIEENRLHGLVAVFLAVGKIGPTVVDRGIVEDIASIAGIEHMERSEYLDRVDVLRGAAWSLVQGMWTAVRAAFTLVQIALSLWILNSVDARLLVLPLFAVLPLLTDHQARKIRNAADLDTGEQFRLQRHLFEVATGAGTSKELRVAGAADELSRRQRAAWDEAVMGRFRARLRAAGWMAVGWTGLRRRVHCRTRAGSQSGSGHRILCR